jgi:diguanylate cyclase
MDNTIIPTHCESIVNHVDSGILLLDRTDCIVVWNQFMEKHSNIESKDILGKNIFDVFPYLPKGWFGLKLKSVRLLKSYSFISWKQRPYLFQFIPKTDIIATDLEYMYQDSTFFPIADPQNGSILVCIMIRDVTEIVHCNRKIEEMKDVTQTLAELANYDSLTAIFNRGYIENQLKLEFNRATRYNSEFSLILFDIDFFKKVNDTYGHLAGDEVLRQVSNAITRNLRNTDIFGRFGGEEFLVMIPNATESTSCIVAEKLRQAIEKLTTKFNSFDISVTISVGFVQYYSNSKDYLQMIHQSDLALYHAKTNGRNITFQYKNNEIIGIGV